VAGIQTTGSSSDGFGADTIRFGDSLTSQQTPILEAMLVQSATTQRHPFSHRTLLVSAHPMIVPEDAEGEHSTESENQVELQDEAKNKKLSIMILATIAIFLVIALIVGLSIGLLIPGSDENHHDDDATTTSTPADVTSGVPFTDDLDEANIEFIKNNNTSPQAKANRWITQDPYQNEMSMERKLLRFWLAVVYYATEGDHAWIHNHLWLEYGTNECDWYTSHPFPICDNDINRTFRVLNLTSNGLVGTMADEMAPSVRI